MQISFKTSKSAARVIGEIVERAMALAQKADVEINRMHLMMDISACHANGCPLALNNLLTTDDGNFAHDVFGIRRHINRQTGQLEDCFLPRFAVSQ